MRRHKQQPPHSIPSARGGVGGGVPLDKSQESLSTEFRKWTSQQKMQRLRKAKSSKSIYDSDRSDRRKTSSSFPHYQTPLGHHETLKSRKPKPHGVGPQEHARKQSQQSQSSVASQSQHSELNLNLVSSSSEDQTHGVQHVPPYGDYMSPSPKQTPTQLTKMWPQTLPNGAFIGTLSNKSSNATNPAVAFHRNSSQSSSVHFDILKHLEGGIQTLENRVPRHYLGAMNQGMVKMALEFCGFDIENEAKFNPLYTQLEQLLKIQNVKTMYVLIQHQPSP